MKKTKKSILTALALGCGMAICLGVAFAPISVAQPATAETAGFYMEFGARVRNKKDSVGIRFDTVVSEEYYNGLKTTYGADAKIEFHTLVARFQDLKDVNEDEKIDETDLTTAMIAKDLQNVGANEADDLTDKGTISFATAELDGETYTYKAAMLYNADGMTYKTYAMELVARSYVKVTYMDGEEEKEYVAYAESNDNIRAMRTVANAAVIDGEDATYLAKYVGTVTENAATGYLGLNNTQATLEAKNLPTAVTTGYIGGRKVNVSVTENGLTATYTAEDVAELEAGENKKAVLSLFDENGNVYRNECTVATKVINSVEDFSVLYLTASDTVIDGYYVLGCDIGSVDDPYIEKNQAGTSGQSPHLNPGAGSYFKGIFNGNGYAVYARESRNGFFGALINGAVVENLAIYSIVDASVGSTGDRFVLAQETGTATIRNCYFSLTDNRVNPTGRYSLFNVIGESSTMTNVVVEYIGWADEKKGGLLFNDEKKTSISAEYTNVYVINNESALISGDQTVYPENTIEMYESNLALKNSGNDFTAFTGVWDTSYGIPVWHSRNEQIIYTATVNGETGNQVQTTVGSKVTLGVGASIYGVPANVTVSYEIMDGDCVSLENNVVTATKAGTAVVTASVNNEVVVQFNITVTLDIINKGTVAYYSAMDGKYIAEDNSEKTLATLVGEGETIAYALDSVGVRIETANIESTLLESAKTYTAMKEVALQLYTEKAVYNVTLQVYTKVLNDKEDLSVLTINGAEIKGYYVVHNDIGSVTDMYDTSVQTAGSGANSFKGTFDGNGYAIYATGSKNGLFGYLGNPGSIKNLTLYSSLSSNIAASGERFALALTAGSTTIQNCYFNITDNRVNPTGTYCLISEVVGTSGFAMENVVAEFVNGYHGVKGSLFRSDLRTAYDSYYSNVYVIAPEGAKITDKTDAYPTGTIDFCTALSEVPSKIVGATWQIDEIAGDGNITYAFKFNDNCEKNS